MVVLIDAKETAVLTGYHNIYIRKLMRKGKFLTGIYVQQGARGRLHFQRDQVTAWVADRDAKKAAKRMVQS